MEDIRTITTPPIIGQRYLVPCVLTDDGKNIPIPIIGEAATDPEIGNNELHLHVDIRFTSDKTFQYWHRKVYRTSQPSPELLDKNSIWVVNVSDVSKIKNLLEKATHSTH